MAMSHDRQEILRAIPSVEKVLQALGDETPLPRPAFTALVRRELARMREDPPDAPPAFGETLGRIRRAAAEFHASRIQPAINATGVVIHTNLGRSPLAEPVVESLRAIAGRYNTLEFDLRTGGRGDRGSYLESNLALLCEAEAATVVNNCASALVLILRHFTAGERKEVVISRGELVAIGGGFRIPDILETSGAQLREIGTTNRTTIDDYRTALGPRTSMILKVHRSNFAMSGFVASPEPAELAALAREHKLPFIQDLGSGAVLPTESLAPVAHEPTPAELLRQGIELLCFSGDKLFGGPQAGVIAGRADLVAALKKNPFFRALRCDRLVLSALQETVDAYLHARAEDSPAPPPPVLSLLSEPVENLRRRARVIVGRLDSAGLPLRASVAECESRIGGGTMPDSSIPSAGVDLRPESMDVEQLAARLRTGAPPVVARTAEGTLKLDLRTVFPDQDETLTRRIEEAAD
jgi:L-seryl-tRNA(Ser) seleniumtransferase